MNTSKIKNYAIQARRDSIKAVTERADFYGTFGGNKIESIGFKGHGDGHEKKGGHGVPSRL